MPTRAEGRPAATMVSPRAGIVLSREPSAMLRGKAFCPPPAVMPLRPPTSMPRPPASTSTRAAPATRGEMMFAPAPVSTAKGNGPAPLTHARRSAPRPLSSRMPTGAGSLRLWPPIRGELACAGGSRREAESAASSPTEKRRAAPRLGEAAHQKRSEAKARAVAAHSADAFRLPFIAQALCSLTLLVVAMTPAQLVGVERRAAPARERADGRALAAADEAADESAAASAHRHRQLVAVLLPEGTTAALPVVVVDAARGAARVARAPRRAVDHALRGRTRACRPGSARFVEALHEAVAEGRALRVAHVLGLGGDLAVQGRVLVVRRRGPVVRRHRASRLHRLRRGQCVVGRGCRVVA